MWWVLLESACRRPEGLPPREWGAPGGRLPTAPPLACLSSWPGTASLEGMAVDVPRSQDRDSMCPAVPSDSTQHPFSPLAGAGEGRVLFGVRVCGHLLLGLRTRTTVSHPGQESATDSREVKLGWLGLRMG